jgi:hypothetical protein
VFGFWLLVALAAFAVVLNWLGGRDGLDLVDASTGAWAYVTTFLLVAADAVCPVFPGEMTLNAASTLAAQGHLTLVGVVVAGVLGAIVGILLCTDAPSVKPLPEACFTSPGSTHASKRARLGDSPGLHVAFMRVALHSPRV